MALSLGEVAMLRYDTSAHVWRDVEGTAARALTLLQAGAPVNGDPEDFETPLITAASYGDAAVARVLIEHGADLEAVARPSGAIPGGTALVHAAVFGMTEVVDVLVAAGAVVDGLAIAGAVGDLRGFLPGSTPEDRLLGLLMATDHERLEVIDELVQAGTPIDQADPFWGRHPLRLAAQNGRVRSVRRLLELGADPNLTDSEGRTPLQLCIEGAAEMADPGRHLQVQALLT